MQHTVARRAIKEHAGQAVIHTSLTSLIILNLLAALAVIGLSWAVKVIRQRQRERRSTRHQVICAVCGTVFTDATRKEVLTCPACGRLNERLKVLDL